MRTDIGEPAFDNIDELLSDRIISHSRRHSEQSSESAEPSRGKRHPSRIGAEEKKKRLLLLTASAAAIFALLFLIHRFFYRKSSN